MHAMGVAAARLDVVVAALNHAPHHPAMDFRRVVRLFQRRFAQSKAEIARAQKCGVYDKFLMNQDLAATIAEAVKLVTQERARRRAGR